MKRRALEAPPLCKKTLSYIQETRNHHPTKLGSFLPKTNWQAPSLHKIFSITTNTKPCPPRIQQHKHVMPKGSSQASCPITSLEQHHLKKE